jgi:tripartite-type tricarboxylate transporter receptor subunit TctC
MKLTRRCFVHLAAGAASIHALPRAARAQAYPTRPITVMVFVGPGGTPDKVFLEQMIEPVGSTPAAFEAFLRAEHDKWGKVIKDAKLDLQP